MYNVQDFGTTSREPSGMAENACSLFLQAMCYFVPYIELVVTHTSVLTILAITVERYYAICLPLQVKTFCYWLIRDK